MAEELHADITVNIVPNADAVEKKLDQITNGDYEAEVKVTTTGEDKAVRTAERTADQIQGAMAGAGQVDLGKTVAGNVANSAKNIQKTLTDATKTGVEEGVKAGIEAGVKAGGKKIKKQAQKDVKDLSKPVTPTTSFNGKEALRSTRTQADQALKTIEEGQKEAEHLQKIADEVEKKRDANDKKLGEIVKKKRNLTVVKGSKIAGKRRTQAQQRGLAEYEQKLQEIEEERAKARSDAAKEYLDTRQEVRGPYESFEIPKTKGQVFAIEAPFGEHYRVDEEAELLKKKYNVMQLYPYSSTGINRGLVSIDGYFPTSGFLTAASNFDRQARALGFTTNLTERYRDWQADYERFDKDPRRAYSYDSEGLQQTISALLEGKRLLEDPKSPLHDYLFNEDGTQKRTIEELENYMYSTPQYVKYFSDKGLINLAMKAKRYNMQRPEAKEWLEEAYAAIGESGFKTPPKELALRSFDPNKVHGYGMEFIGDDPEQGIYAWFNDIVSDWNPNQRDLLGWVKEQKGWKRGKYTATNYKRGTTNGGIALADAGDKLERDLKKIDQDFEKERDNAEWLKNRYTYSPSRNGRYFRDRYRLNSESSGRLAGIRSNALLEYQAKQQQKIEKQVLKEIPDNQQELFDELRQEYAAKTQQSIAKADEAISILPEKVAPLVDELDVARGSDALFEKALLGVTEAMMGAEAEQNKTAQQFSSRALYRARNNLWKEIKSKGYNTLSIPERITTDKENNEKYEPKSFVTFKDFEDFSDVLQSLWEAGPDETDSELSPLLFPDDPKKAALIAALFANNGEGLARADKYTKEQSAIRQVNKAKQRASTQVTQENKAWEQYWQEDEAYTKAMEERRAEADKYLSEHHDEHTSYGSGNLPIISTAEKASFWAAFDQVEYEAEQLLISDTQKLIEARRVREAATKEAEHVAKEAEQQELQSKMKALAQAHPQRTQSRRTEARQHVNRGYDFEQYREEQREKAAIARGASLFSTPGFPALPAPTNDNQQERPYVLSGSEFQKILANRAASAAPTVSGLIAENPRIEATGNTNFIMRGGAYSDITSPSVIPMPGIPGRQNANPFGMLRLPEGYHGLGLPGAGETSMDATERARVARDAEVARRTRAAQERAEYEAQMDAWAEANPFDIKSLIWNAAKKQREAQQQAPTAGTTPPVIPVNNPILDVTGETVINTEQPPVQETPETPPRATAINPEFEQAVREMEEMNSGNFVRPVRTPPVDVNGNPRVNWVRVSGANVAETAEQLKAGFNLDDALAQQVLKGVREYDGIQIASVDRVQVNYANTIGDQEGPDRINIRGRDTEGNVVNITRSHRVRQEPDVATGENVPVDYWENTQASVTTDFKARANEAERLQKQMDKARTSYDQMQNTLTGPESKFSDTFKGQAEDLSKSLAEAFSTLEGNLTTDNLEAYNQKLKQVKQSADELAKAQKATEKSQASYDQFKVKAEAKIAQADELAGKLQGTENEALRQRAADLTAGTGSNYADLKQAMADWDSALKSGSVEKQTAAMNAAKAALAGLNAEYRNGTQALKQYEKDQKSLESGVASSLKDVEKIRKKYTLTDQQQRDLNEIENQIKVSADTSQLKAAQGQLEAFKATLEDTAKTGASMGSRIGAAMKSLFPALSAFRLVSKGLATFKKSISNVTAIDKSMTAFKQTATATSAQFGAFLDNATAKSKDLAVNITDYIDAATEFSRLGESFADSALLGEASIKLKNVGADIKSVTDASSYLIATMKGFGLATKDVTHITDAMTYLGNNMPVTAGGIGEALQRSAASMSAAGNTMEQTMALITTGNAIVQNPERVGSALNVLALRIRGSKAELSELGEETDEYCESASKMRKQVKALAGVDIMKSETQYKDTYTIMKEIAAVWDKLSDINQAALTEALFGKLRANVGTSILQNFDMAEESLEALTSGKAEGYTETAYGTYLDSIEAKAQTLTTTFQALSLELTNSGLISFGYDISTGFLGTIESIVSGVNNITESITGMSGSLKALPGIVAVAYTALTRLGKLRIADFMGTGQGLFVNGYTGPQVAARKAAESTSYNALKGWFASTGKSQMLPGDLENLPQNVQAQITGWGGYLNEMNSDVGLLSSNLDELHAKQEKIANQKFTVSGDGAGFFKNLAANIGGMVAQMAIMYGIMLLVTKGIEILDKHANARKYSMQAAEEAYKNTQSMQDEIDARNKTYKENIDTIIKYKDKVGENGENRGLSTEEMAEYQAAANALGEALPDLVAYWDESGNAVLRAKDKVDEYTEALQRANLVTLTTDWDEDADDLVKGANAAVNSQNTEWSSDLLGNFGVWAPNNAVYYSGEENVIKEINHILETEEDSSKRMSLVSGLLQKVYGHVGKGLYYEREYNKSVAEAPESFFKSWQQSGYNMEQYYAPWFFAQMSKNGFSFDSYTALSDETWQKFMDAFSAVDANWKSITTKAGSQLNSVALRSFDIMTNPFSTYKSEGYSDIDAGVLTIIRRAIAGMDLEDLLGMNASNANDISAYIGKYILKPLVSGSTYQQALTEFSTVASGFDTGTRTIGQVNAARQRAGTAAEKAGLNDDIAKAIADTVFDSDYYGDRVAHVTDLISDEWDGFAESLTKPMLDFANGIDLKSKYQGYNWDETTGQVSMTMGEFFQAYAEFCETINDDWAGMKTTVDNMTKRHKTLTEALTAQDSNGGVLQYTDDLADVLKSHPEYATGETSILYKGIDGSTVIDQRALQKRLAAEREDVIQENIKAITSIDQQIEKNSNTLKDLEENSKNLSDADKARLNTLKSNNASLERERLNRELLIQQLRFENSVYGRWLAGKGGAEAGDNFRDLHSAVTTVEEGLKSGRRYTNAFVTSADMLFGENAWRDWDNKTFASHIDAYNKLYTNEGQLNLKTMNQWLNKAGLTTAVDNGDWTDLALDDSGNIDLKKMSDALSAQGYAMSPQMVGQMLLAASEYWGYDKLGINREQLQGLLEQTQTETETQANTSAVTANTAALSALTSAISVLTGQQGWQEGGVSAETAKATGGKTRVLRTSDGGAVVAAASDDLDKYISTITGGRGSAAFTLEQLLGMDQGQLGRGLFYGGFTGEGAFENASGLAQVLASGGNLDNYFASSALTKIGSLIDESFSAGWTETVTSLSTSGQLLGQAATDLISAAEALKGAAGGGEGEGEGSSPNAFEVVDSNKFIDLNDRQKVSSKQMHDLGWTDVEDGDYATIYSSSFSNGKGEEYLFTPLFSKTLADELGRAGMQAKPEGSEYDPDQYFEDYVERFFETGEDPWHLVLSDAYPEQEGGNSDLQELGEAYHQRSAEIEEAKTASVEEAKAVSAAAEITAKEAKDYWDQQDKLYKASAANAEKELAEANAAKAYEDGRKRIEQIKAHAAQEEHQEQLRQDIDDDWLDKIDEHQEALQREIIDGEVKSLHERLMSDLREQGSTEAEKLKAQRQAQRETEAERREAELTAPQKAAETDYSIQQRKQALKKAGEIDQTIIQPALTERQDLINDITDILATDKSMANEKWFRDNLGVDWSRDLEAYDNETLGTILSQLTDVVTQKAVEKAQRDGDKRTQQVKEAQEEAEWHTTVDDHQESLRQDIIKGEMKQLWEQAIAANNKLKEATVEAQNATVETPETTEPEIPSMTLSPESMNTPASYYEALKNGLATNDYGGYALPTLYALESGLSDMINNIDDQFDWDRFDAYSTKDQAAMLMNWLVDHSGGTLPESAKQSLSTDEVTVEADSTVVESSAPPKTTEPEPTPAPEKTYESFEEPYGGYNSPYTYALETGLFDRIAELEELTGDLFDWDAFDAMSSADQMATFDSWISSHQPPQDTSIDADNSGFMEANEEVEAAGEEPVTKPINGDPSGANAAIDQIRAKAAEGAQMPITIITPDTSGGNNSSTEDGDSFATGTPSAPGGPSLVGEAGDEIVVDTKRGSWHLTQGPELLNLNKGDIVYNAKQTSELLRRHQAMGGSAHAKGYNNGKAFAKGKPDEKLSIGVGDSNVAYNPSSSSSSSSNASKAAKEMTDAFNKLYDWIERLIAVAKEKTDKLVDSVKDLVNYWSRNNRVDQAIKAAQAEQKVNRRAAARYRKQADDTAKKYGLSASYVKKIQEGKLDIESLSEETKAKVAEYKKWYDKALAAESRIEELADQIKELQLSKFDNIVDYYTGRVDYRKSLQAVSSANVDYKNASGKTLTKYDFTPQLHALGFQRSNLQSERDAMQKQFDDLIKNGTIREGDENYYKYKKAIADLDEQILKADTDIQKVQDEINRLPLTKLEYALNALKRISTEIQNIFSLNQAQNWTPITDEEIDTTTGYYNDLIKNGMKQIKNLKDQRKILVGMLDGLDKNSEKYQEILGEIDQIDASIASVMQDQEQWNDAIIDLQIESQRRQREELEKQNDQYKKQKEYEEALLELEKARTQKTKLIFREGELYAPLRSDAH